MTVRILLIDDHTLFRSGIKSLLSRQPDFEVVGEASDGLEGVKRAKSLSPDVVLLDINMPGVSGREAVSMITEDVPGTRVIMLTVSEDSDDLIDCLRAGAQGYLLKNIDTSFLLDSLRRAAEGESVMSSQMMNKLMGSLRNAPSAEEKNAVSLTPREREILALLAHGASNKELSRTLSLAEGTIKIHVQNILKKLKLSSRVQAAVYAVENGIVAR